MGSIISTATLAGDIYFPGGHTKDTRVNVATQIHKDHSGFKNPHLETPYCKRRLTGNKNPRPLRRKTERKQKIREEKKTYLEKIKLETLPKPKITCKPR